MGQNATTPSFASLFAAEDRHFWFRARNEIIAAVLRPLTVSRPPGYRVLEVGCGTGNTLRVLERVCAGGRVVGMDLFLDGLRYARQRVSCPLVQGDVLRMPFRPGFDFICLFDVLEHLPDDRRVLRAVRALLAPHGKLVLTVPAHMALWSYFDEASEHYRRYTAAELGGKLRQTGYRVDYLTEYMAALYPLMWLGRRLASLKRWLRPGGPVTARQLADNELRLVPGLNGLLRWLLTREAALVRNRRKLPVGTSLLAVAAAAPTAPPGSTG